MTKRPPKNVCPCCGVRCEQVKHKHDDTTAQSDRFNSRVRCSSCGHVHRQCELRHYTPSEKEAVERDKKERYNQRKRERYAANIEQGREQGRIYYANNRERIRKRQNACYAASAEVRQAACQRARAWQEAHKEHRKRYMKLYRYANAHGLYIKRKQRELRKAKEAIA